MQKLEFRENLVAISPELVSVIDSLFSCKKEELPSKLEDLLIYIQSLYDFLLSLKPFFSEEIFNKLDKKLKDLYVEVEQLLDKEDLEFNLIEKYISKLILFLDEINLQTLKLDLTTLQSLDRLLSYISLFLEGEDEYKKLIFFEFNIFIDELLKYERLIYKYKMILSNFLHLDEVSSLLKDLQLSFDTLKIKTSKLRGFIDNNFKEVKREELDEFLKDLKQNYSLFKTALKDLDNLLALTSDIDAILFRDLDLIALSLAKKEKTELKGLLQEQLKLITDYIESLKLSLYYMEVFSLFLSRQDLLMLKDSFLDVDKSFTSFKNFVRQIEAKEFNYNNFKKELKEFYNTVLLYIHTLEEFEEFEAEKVKLLPTEFRVLIKLLRFYLDKTIPYFIIVNFILTQIDTYFNYLLLIESSYYLRKSEFKDEFLKLQDIVLKFIFFYQELFTIIADLQEDESIDISYLFSLLKDILKYLDDYINLSNSFTEVFKDDDLMKRKCGFCGALNSLQADKCESCSRFLPEVISSESVFLNIKLDENLYSFALLLQLYIEEKINFEILSKFLDTVDKKLNLVDKINDSLQNLWYSFLDTLQYEKENKEKLSSLWIQLVEQVKALS